jgi:hypothetical protein
LAVVTTDVGCFPERVVDVPQATVLRVSTEPRVWLDTFENLRAALESGAARGRFFTPKPDDFYNSRYLEPLVSSSDGDRSGVHETSLTAV